MEFQDPFKAITEKVQAWVDAHPDESHRSRKLATERVLDQMGIKLLSRGNVLVDNGVVTLKGWSIDPRRWLGLPDKPITPTQVRELQSKGALK